jgi:hypothetical protein
MIDPVNGAASWPSPVPSASQPPAFEPAEIATASPPDPPQLGAPALPISSADAIARYLGAPAERIDAGGTDFYV